MKYTAPLLDLSPHEQKYDDLANLLGIETLKALVPFSQAQVDYALTTARDENLNTLSLFRWDSQHRNVSALVRFVVRRELYRAAAARVPFRALKGWSLSSSVCLLKHVARFYPREEN